MSVKMHAIVVRVNVELHFGVFEVDCQALLDVRQDGPDAVEEDSLDLEWSGQAKKVSLAAHDAEVMPLL